MKSEICKVLVSESETFKNVTWKSPKIQLETWLQHKNSRSRVLREKRGGGGGTLEEEGASVFLSDCF